MAAAALYSSGPSLSSSIRSMIAHAVSEKGSVREFQDISLKFGIVYALGRLQEGNASYAHFFLSGLDYDDLVPETRACSVPHELEGTLRRFVSVL